MSKPGKIKIHRDPPAEGIPGERSFSVVDRTEVLLPFYKADRIVPLAEIADAVGEAYVGPERVSCTKLDRLSSSGVAILSGPIMDYEGTTRRRPGPPMTEEPCPRCGGEGKVVVVDRERLRAERESRGLTQRDVAKAAGWTGSQVSMLESGARPLSEISAERYWNALQAAGRGA